MSEEGVKVVAAPDQTETGAETAEVTSPKYIFLFIGDGMSYPQIQLANYYLSAVADTNENDILESKNNLNMMNFPVVGSAQTYDSTSFCPDSASTATSISTGYKTYRGTINMDETGTISYETIAEKLKKAYEITMSRTGEEKKFSQEEYVLYESYEPLTVTITHLLNNKSGISFSSFAHTGLPVEVFAMGPGQEDFDGYYDNTQIYSKLAALTGVN